MLAVDEVTVRFRKGVRRKPIVALDRLSLRVREGDFLALLGENGAGKSTAMYCFLGLIHPTEGRVLLLGERPELGSRSYARIAYLPEEPHYHLYLTVEEAVTYYALLSGARAAAAEVGSVLERLGLAEFRQLRLSKCSKGMKQKVGIAQCLFHRPILLFLDEPMRGLDPVIVREFRTILAELHRDGATIVMNSHMLSEVEALASRVAILERGKLVVDDTLENLLRSDQDHYSVEFVGEDPLPPYLTIQSRTDRTIQATMPVESFDTFMAHAGARGFKISSCVLTGRSLEDSFLSVLRKERSDA